MKNDRERLESDFEKAVVKLLSGNLPMTESSIWSLAESVGVAKEMSRAFVHYQLRHLEKAGKLKSTQIRRNTYWVSTSPGSASLPGQR